MTFEEAVPIVVATTASTTFLVAGADWLIRMWLQKHRDEVIDTLTKRNAELQSDADEARAKRDEANLRAITRSQELSEIRSILEAEREKNAAVSEKSDRRAAAITALEADGKKAGEAQKKFHGRIRRALALEGQIWTQPTMAGTPRFSPLSERRTPIVSVLNLKGGVGKTTLTAYLAWALANRGYRVLLVDLDLQGSLSSLFVHSEQLAAMAKGGHNFLQHYLADLSAKVPANLLDFTLPVPQLNSHSRLVATTDRLAYAELNQTVQWLLRVGGTGRGWNGKRDGRMILRRALHSRALYSKFDVVLMDCPPLLNLCCANALAASDYVLTPIMPSVKSVERVTPLLRRVMEVKKDVNPDLRMLGIVVNSTQERDLTPREKDLLVNLPRQCLDVYGSDVYRFDTHIPQRVAVRDGEAEFVAPDARHPLRTTFEALAEEFLKRLPADCRHPDERKLVRKTLGGAQ